MKLIFFGPQGSGKGTQAQIISEKLKIPHISSGDLLRSTKGKLKEEIDSYINKGNMIPNELMLEILKERLSKKDCEKGYILEGYPRNIKQAHSLEKMTKIDKSFEIYISDEESIKRIVNRQTCRECHVVYNILTNPPKIKNICDKCHGPLYQREDDSLESLQKRLSDYHEKTGPAIKYYKAIRINGEQSIDKVSKEILKFLH